MIAIATVWKLSWWWEDYEHIMAIGWAWRLLIYHHNFIDLLWLKLKRKLWFGLLISAAVLNSVTN
jgi:hypothetical protein